MPRTVLVIGGGAAGIGAARAAKATDPSTTVIVYADDLGDGTGERARTARQKLGAAGAELRTETVSAVDTAARTVTAVGAGAVAYDALVITAGAPGSAGADADTPGAAGSDPNTAFPTTAGPTTADPNTAGPNTAGPNTAGLNTAGLNTAVPGTELRGVVTADDRSAAAGGGGGSFVDENSPSPANSASPANDGGTTRAVVVGATSAGLAAAAELLAQGVQTHLVDPGRQLLAGTVDPDVVAPIAEQLTAAGLHLHLRTTVEAFLGDDGQLRAVATSEGELPADLAVLATPPVPGNRVAAAAGLRLGPSGRIAVDAGMRTSAAAVFAAGSVCEPAPGAPTGLTTSHAYAQGRAAGTNAAGGTRSYHAAYVPWGVPAGEAVVGGAGFDETTAAEQGIAYVLGSAEGISRARYYPGVQKVAVKLLAEPGSLRLIGAQLRGGGEGVKERANFLAQAVRLGLTLHDLSTMENVYSPAIGALNEPIVVAATNGLNDLAAGS